MGTNKRNGEKVGQQFRIDYSAESLEKRFQNYFIQNSHYIII